ncbi:hypothetical protein FRZ06_04745 [Anoxybacterium hadale]|uniref:Uncharacterized protein n=1 Tax=Anoxybacterium hadale TaxID=3408580 RepID=A0ACD1A8D4_9FIRM|nr:hypothetical protein FRZ06_04745 [Clostridiales bacterium]
MNKLTRNRVLSSSLVSVVSFILLYAGVRFVLDHQISFNNILAYAGFSLLIGVIASMLYLFRPKLSLSIFLAGLLVGFVSMYRAFLADGSGWGDLAGLISLFFFVILGLITGLIVQLAYHLYEKFVK